MQRGSVTFYKLDIIENTHSSQHKMCTCNMYALLTQLLYVVLTVLGGYSDVLYGLQYDYVQQFQCHQA